MSGIQSPFDLAGTFTVPVSCIVEGKTMSLAPSGRDAVLAGRKGLSVIDLENPYNAPRRLHHETSWEVADVQWCPHLSRPSWVVSTSNQKAILWNLDRPSRNAIEFYLHAHTRAITDINFCPHDPNLLSTCSVDSFIYTWDMRAPETPVIQFSHWKAAASQVKWNHVNPNLLASSHGHHVMIWDIRKSAQYLQSIDAHNGRVNGIDWSRTSKHEIITCSNDMTVKFWSIYDPKATQGDSAKLNYTINTNFPVNRARHVPFGDHCCGIMPLRGGNNSIYIVKYKDQEGVSQLKPSYIFKGHSEPVKDFLWRSRHSNNSPVDDRDFQLVTCSSDYELRLWPIDEDMHDNFNYVKGRPLPDGEKLINFPYKSYASETTSASNSELIIRHKSGSTRERTSFSHHHIAWISGVKIGQSVFTDVRNDPNSLGFDDSLQPTNLGEEVSSVSAKFPKLKFEKMNFVTKNLIISINGPWSSENEEDLIFVRIDINIPESYPSKNGVPKFRIEETHGLTDLKKKEILTNLEVISKKYCSAKRFCLDPCVRFLLGEKDINLNFEEIEEPILPTFFDPFELSNEVFYRDNDDESGHASTYSKRTSSGESDEEGTDNALTSDLDLNVPAIDNVPLPKGCGAVWTPSGHLVCFFIPKEEKKIQREAIKFGNQGFSLTNRLKKKDNVTSLDNALSDTKDNLSDDDDDVSSINSEDSLSNDFDILQSDRHYRTRAPMLLRETVKAPSKFSGGAKSGTLSIGDDISEKTSKSKSKSTESHSMVKIYDFSDIIPAKMDLALKYRILGDTPENLARHNAIVADEYGYSELRDCWNILSVVLVKDFHVFDEAIAYISSMSQCELKHKLYEGIKGDKSNTRRVYWGYHPFGGSWLAAEMMNYFENIGDIQMLAMLSCITFENEMNKLKSSVPIQTPYAVPNISPSATKYNGFKKMSQLQKERTQYNVSFKNSKSVTDLSTFPSGSHQSSSIIKISYKREPIPRKYGIDSILGIRARNLGIENTAIVKRQPPSSLSVNNASSASFVKTLNNNKKKKKKKKNIISPLSTQNLISLKTKGPNLQIQMLNEEQLNSREGIYSMNLQNAMDKEKLKSWRSEYASLLYFWGLPAGRIKMLKFNYSSGEQAKLINSPSNDYKEHIGGMGWFGKKSYRRATSTVSKWEGGNELRKCHYCGKPASKRITGCIVCNHILHASCACQWWEEDDMDECPSGCGCNCLEFYHGDISYI